MNGPWRVLDGPAGGLQVYATAPGAAGPTSSGPALLLCHELPRENASALEAARTFPALADRLAAESGCRVVTGRLRGAGGSQGSFSAAGWLEDLRFLRECEIGEDASVRAIGFGLGGTLALRLAAEDPRIVGVACIGSPADLSPRVADPVHLLEQCRRSGVVHGRGVPRNLDDWAAELAVLQPLEAATALGERPLLVVHGTDDRDVPVIAARALARAASGPVDLRIVLGAGHWLWADPRVVATLIGWLERQR